MRIHYLLFILIITLFGYFVQANNGWYKWHTQFGTDTAKMIMEFDARLSDKEDLMQRALDSYGTQIHVNKAWIKKTIAKIDENKVKG